MNVELKPRSERDAVGRSGHRGSCVRRSSQVPGMRAFMINPPPINIGAPVRPRAVSVHAAGHRHRRAVSLGPDPRREDEGAARAAGRQQRPAGQQPADLDRPEPRPDFRARPHRQPGPDGDVQRLRHAADLADLCAEQPIPGHPGRRSGIPARSFCALPALRPVIEPAVSSRSSLSRPPRCRRDR